MTDHTNPADADRVSFLDAVERVGTTFVQAIIVYVLSTSFTDELFWQGFLTAVVIGAANGVKVLLTVWVPTFTNWWADTAYRVVSTFVSAFAGSYVAVEFLDIGDLSYAAQAAGAAAMSALVVLKAVIALRRPPGITPASLVTARGNLAA